MVQAHSEDGASVPICCQDYHHPCSRCAWESPWLRKGACGFSAGSSILEPQGGEPLTPGSTETWLCLAQIPARTREEIPEGKDTMG